LGDNVFDGCEDQFKKAVEKFQAGKFDVSLFFKEREDASRFGVATIVDDNLVKIVEKPEKPESKFAQVGFYLCKPVIFGHIKTLKPSGRGELEMTDLNNIFVNKGTAGFEILDGEWFDTGTVDSLHLADCYFADKKQKS
ncbi:MAG: sugar phosphate nucleotidyltransferase, partial [Candidatus Wolfebacteria bacterium]|nr:sugar phosphate nucleotidyltransferase [Candidatus Wolfebacteria bacterium]